MKIGVISDIHGNVDALRAVLGALAGRTAAIWFLGDACGYYPFAKSCLGLLRETGAVCLRGNHDDVLLTCWRAGTEPDDTYRRRYGTALARSLAELEEDDLLWMESWPPTCRLTVSGRRALLAHGTPQEPLTGRLYPDADAWESFAGMEAEIILMGHTHYPLVRHVGDVLIANPGSVGQPRDCSASAAFGILDPAALTFDLERCPFDPAPLIDDAHLHAPELPYLTEVLTR